MSITAISIFAALLPIFVYILFLRWIDRYEPEPFKTLFITFILGATFSAGVSYVVNTFLGGISSVLMNQSASDYASAGLIAPFVEETSKGLIVLLFAALSKEFDNLTDGLIYGAVVGLGFAFAENILYFTRVYEEGGQFAWITNMYTRSLFCTGLHACATALFGAGVAYAKSFRWYEKIGIVIVGWFLAMMVHSFWNSLLTAASLSNDSFLGMIPFVSLPFIFFTIFVLIQLSLMRESQLIEEALMAEAKDGLIPVAHVSYIKSVLTRDLDGWLESHVNKEQYIQLTTDLAFVKNRYWMTPEPQRAAHAKELEALREKIRKLLEKQIS